MGTALVVLGLIAIVGSLTGCQSRRVLTENSSDEENNNDNQVSKDVNCDESENTDVEISSEQVHADTEPEEVNEPYDIIENDEWAIFNHVPNVSNPQNEFDQWVLENIVNNWDGRWNQDALNHLWEKCHAESEKFGLVINPCVFLGILQQEGNGSFNTAPAEGGHNDPGAGLIVQDINAAVNLVSKKIAGYSVFGEKYVETVSGYGSDKMTLDGIGDYNGGVFEYINYSLPGCQIVDNKIKEEVGAYSTSSKWNQVVEEYTGRAMNAYRNVYGPEIAVTGDLEKHKLGSIYAETTTYSKYVREQMINNMTEEEKKNANLNHTFERVRVNWPEYKGGPRHSGDVVNDRKTNYDDYEYVLEERYG